MLLLLQGAGIQAPVVDGVRAYATVMYSAVTGAGVGFSLVGVTDGGVTTTTGAEVSQRPTTGADTSTTATTGATPSEE